VRVEEALELVFGAGVCEVTLDDDHVRVEAAHLADHGAVHHLGVRRVSRLGAQDRAQLLLAEVADATALDLAEMHVVGRRDRRQEATGWTLGRRERPLEPIAPRRAVGHARARSCRTTSMAAVIAAISSGEASGEMTRRTGRSGMR